MCVSIYIYIHIYIEYKSDPFMKIYSGFYGDDIANNISRGCVQEWGIYT